MDRVSSHSGYPALDRGQTASASNNGSVRAPYDRAALGEPPTDAEVPLPLPTAFENARRREQSGPTEAESAEREAEPAPGDDSGVHAVTKATDYWFNMEVHGLEKEARLEAEQWAHNGLPRHDVLMEGPLPVEQALAGRAAEIFRQWTVRVQTRLKDAIARRTYDVRSEVAALRAHVDGLRETRSALLQAARDRQALLRGHKREPSSIGYRTMLHGAWFWLLMTILVAVDFVANVPVFMELLPPDARADRIYGSLADQSELHGLWAGLYRIWAKIVTYPDASLLALGVIILLVFLGDRVGVGSRALFAYSEKDAPSLAQGVRRHRRQSWAPLVACLLGGVAVISVLYMSRERILSRAQERLTEDDRKALVLEQRIQDAQQQKDLQAVSALNLELGTVQADRKTHEERVSYASTIQSMNIPILFLNVALFIAAAVAAYTGHGHTLAEGRGEDPRVRDLTRSMQSLRLEALRRREQIWSAAREVDGAFTTLRHLLRARPLQHWEGKAERLRRVIPLFRSDNARLRHMDPASIRAFQQTVPIDLPPLEGDAPLVSEPQDLTSLEAEYQRLRAEFEQMAPESELVAAEEVEE